MRIVVAFLFLAHFLFAEQNFSEAKKILTKFYQDYSQYQTDFYCNAPFKWVKNRFEIVPSEAYSPRNVKTKKGNINQRAKRIEWEHIMPAHNFGQHLPCWRKGGRKECQNDATFNKMEGIYKILFQQLERLMGIEAIIDMRSLQKICNIRNMETAKFLQILKARDSILLIILRAGLLEAIFI